MRERAPSLMPQRPLCKRFLPADTKKVQKSAPEAKFELTKRPDRRILGAPDQRFDGESLNRNNKIQHMKTFSAKAQDIERQWYVIDA
ncbi:MAG: hypothetical protein MR890_09715, partial [Akkermansia muciniphila]|nr:hypothetical protein [Akkermansia muciniphila]